MSRNDRSDDVSMVQVTTIRCLHILKKHTKSRRPSSWRERVQSSVLTGIFMEIYVTEEKQSFLQSDTDSMEIIKEIAYSRSVPGTRNNHVKMAVW